VVHLAVDAVRREALAVSAGSQAENAFLVREEAAVVSLAVGTGVTVSIDQGRRARCGMLVDDVVREIRL
jgi:hypothetical protein